MRLIPAVLTFVAASSVAAYAGGDPVNGEMIFRQCTDLSRHRTERCGQIRTTAERHPGESLGILAQLSILHRSRRRREVGQGLE